MQHAVDMRDERRTRYANPDAAEADDRCFYRGASMAGTFRRGDRLTVAHVPLAGIVPGDVVVFRAPDGCSGRFDLVHRVVAVAPDGLVARGDSNPRDDVVRVTAGNFVGRVTHAERDRRTVPVAGGRLGLVRGRILHARLGLWRLVRTVAGPAYRRLRHSGLVRRWWCPVVTQLRLHSKQGPLVKYVCGGRTVACWWPDEGRFECRRPYDLVIRPPNDGQARRTP